MAGEQSVLMDAILSMDAYNRGHSPGMLLPNTVVPDGAEIVGLSQDILAADSPENYSFYATAYDWDGQTIIAYRGTMMTGTGAFGIDANDITFGWPVGGGSATAMQAQLAIEFFQAVAAKEDRSLLPGGADASDWQSADIEVTGHSITVTRPPLPI